MTNLPGYATLRTDGANTVLPNPQGAPYDHACAPAQYHRER